MNNNLSDIKVSLILPIYNVGRFFDECMQSVLSQSHKNIEVVLVDDGSTDDSGDIADQYAVKDKRVRVFHKKNQGVSSARNFGIDKSTGEYLCFADPDDILKSDYVDYMLRLCIDNDAEVSICAEVFTVFKRAQPLEDLKVVSGEQAAADILYGKITVGCYSKMFKKSLLDVKKIRFFEDVYIGEGFNFNVIAFCASDRVAISQHKVYYYRLDNAGSAMTKFNIKKCEMAIKAIDIIRENLSIHTAKLSRAVDFADWTTHGSMYDWMVMANIRKQYPDMYYKCEKKVHKLAPKAIFAPTTLRVRIAAITRSIHPYLWALLRKTARRIVICG